jgi:protein-S-isoprenylcysteine O-methyltransferase Ste14
MLSLIILFTGSKWEETLIVSDILFVIGVVLVGIATVGRLWCSVYISGYKVKNLITTGPYSMCRNPLYFFSLLGSVGIGLATETFTIPAIISISFALYYPHVIKKEENRLATAHKEKFENYYKRIPKFIPSFSSYIEPEEYVIKPRILRKRFFDSLWFVWILGFLEIIEALHEHSIIPAFFNLY